MLIRPYVIPAMQYKLSSEPVETTRWSLAKARWRYSPILPVTGENDSDVGSTYPGAGEGSKGLAVRQLKSHASWVQTVDKRR